MPFASSSPSPRKPSSENVAVVVIDVRAAQAGLAPAGPVIITRSQPPIPLFEPALNLLQTILVGGHASRLNRALVEEKKLAVAIGGGWSEGFDANVFFHSCNAARRGVDLKFERGWDAELATIVEHGVSEAELRRANMAAADFWRGVSTIDGKARLLGEYAVMRGDYRLLFAAPEAYERVTRAGVASIARQVFNPDKRTVGVLLPSAGDESVTGPLRSRLSRRSARACVFRPTCVRRSPTA